jgi:hypothetical protein
MTETIAVALITSASGFIGIIFGAILTSARENKKVKKNHHRYISKLSLLTTGVIAQIKKNKDIENRKSARDHFIKVGNIFSNDLLNGISNIDNKILFQNIESSLSTLNDYKNVLRESSEYISEALVHLSLEVQLVVEKLELDISSYKTKFSKSGAMLKIIMENNDSPGCQQSEFDTYYRDSLSSFTILENTHDEFVSICEKFSKQLNAEVMQLQQL